MKNSSLFRDVVKEVGLSCANYLWADGEEYLDTFKLMTRVMKTHGLCHILSRKMILHFFNVSYYWELELLREAKEHKRDELLKQY